VLTPGGRTIQSLTGLGIGIPIVPPAPTETSCPSKSVQNPVSPKGGSRGNQQLGDQLQDNSTVQGPAACSLLELLVKTIFTCSLILHEELLANHKERHRCLRSHC